MAKFLTTVGNSYYLEQIIINATKSLTLVTPYLKLSKNFIERLSDADKNEIKITLLYGKSELRDDEKEKLYTLKNIEIFFCQHLHAKCYYNENEMIITSINLYEFSERNNREMGLFIQRETDSDIFRDTLKEVESIKNSSELIKQHKTKEDIIESLCSLEDDYEEQWNFHLPSLHKILTKKYKKHNIELDNEIFSSDFPKESINIDVSYRVNFYFEDSFTFDSFRAKNSKKIDKALPNYRVYWNADVINIYLEEGYYPSINQQGLEEKTSKFIEIIETFYKFLNK